MKTQNLMFGASVLALGLATLAMPARAQGPMYDTVYVNLPYSITIGDKTLQPGDYVIQELQTQNKSRVLDMYSNHGRTFETSAITIPAYKVVPPDSTSVVLHHFGNDYYFDKVWIEGKNYGYEFPLPNRVKEREKELLQPITVAAQYQAETPQAAVPPPVEQQPEIAQAQPAPAPQPAPEVQPQPAPQASREMPRTSADWLMMLLSGGAFSGAGLTLLRRRRA
jgi:hypothetical protein